VIIHVIGSRAHTDAKRPQHMKNTCLLIVSDNYPIVIDMGEGVKKADVTSVYQPKAILLTHAHEDHVGPGIDDLNVDTYATAITWDIIGDKLSLPDDKRHTIKSGETFELGPYKITPWKVVHSIRAPAVGYLIDDGKFRVFVSPDFLDLYNIGHKLGQIDV